MYIEPLVFVAPFNWIVAISALAGWRFLDVVFQTIYSSRKGVLDIQKKLSPKHQFPIHFRILTSNYPFGGSLKFGHDLPNCDKKFRVGHVYIIVFSHNQ